MHPADAFLILVFVVMVLAVYWLRVYNVRSIRQWRCQEAEVMADLLMAALIQLRRGENCWCEMAIGNPMLREHSMACQTAQHSMMSAEAMVKWRTKARAY